MIWTQTQSHLNSSSMTETYFNNASGADIVLELVKAIHQNKDYLSEIDGKIGDGDHGINMNKGFVMAGEKITSDMSFSSAMKLLGDTLLMEIGGSMGPIYGTFFRKSAKTIKDYQEIDAPTFALMLRNALDGIQDIGGAKEGDKTLIDCFAPSLRAFENSIKGGADFASALKAASNAAEEGKDSTKDMMAKVGRASRLGERSIGVLDAGSVSCCIILTTLYQAIAERLVG